MQLDLFKIADIKKAVEVIKPQLSIPFQGLTYLPNFISDEEHSFLWESINSENWMSDLKRRVQHYGYKYDYRKRSIDYSMYLGEIPKWTNFLTQRIFDRGLINIFPDQVIVNEYLPGQGIADHVDCEPCFDGIVISLSLGSPCIMEFKKKFDRNNKFDLLLEPKSLVVLQGEARYNWTHGIAGRTTDNWRGENLIRKTRISLTFRKVILN